MKSDYERKNFQTKYLICSVIFLLLVLIALWISFGKITPAIFVIVLLCTIMLVVLNRICYGYLNSICEDVEIVSAQMLQVMENKESLESVAYKEGTVGILYSNFEKMVYALQKSREKELNEKLFLRDIISDISHQLKTPLASLNVFVDLLLEDKVDEAKKQKILEESANQLNRMEWMVLSMLKLARIEAGAISFEKKETDLYSVLMRAREGVQFLVDERKQKLIIECDENCRIVCDGDWLVEAIINLLKNASDYSPTESSIMVQVEYTDIYTRIYIKDEGCGIPEEELPNIFKRFYRVNQEVNPNSVGIGLSLTKSIVEGMGGSIHVQSELGKYTWFALTFLK